MPIIELTTGDASGDGHSIREKFLYECNRTAEEIEEAVKLCKEKTGIDPSMIACEYEDHTIPLEMRAAVRDMLKSQGMYDFADFVEDQGVVEDVDDFLRIYLACAQHVDPDFTFEKITPHSYRNKIDIGGYGLYYI
jgi:hypothetical protein